MGILGGLALMGRDLPLPGNRVVKGHTVRTIGVLLLVSGAANFGGFVIDRILDPTGTNPPTYLGDLVTVFSMVICATSWIGAIIIAIIALIRSQPREVEM